MANIKSAKKRIRVIEKKTQRNRRVKAHLKEIIKGFDAAISENNEQEARDFLALTEKKLLQAGAKGTIHKNAASRKVARLTKRFVQVFGPDALKLKANPPAIPTPEEKAAQRAEKEAAKAEALAKKKGRKAVAASAAVKEEVAEAAPEETVEAEEAAEAAPEEPEAAAADEPAEPDAPAEETSSETDAPAEETSSEADEPAETDAPTEPEAAEADEPAGDKTPEA
jgi:small subunit ribosomal protein S20